VRYAAAFPPPPEGGGPDAAKLGGRAGRVSTILAPLGEAEPSEATVQIQFRQAIYRSDRVARRWRRWSPWSSSMRGRAGSPPSPVSWPRPRL